MLHDTLHFAVHYFLHLFFPYFLARWFWPQAWRKAYFWMLGTMLVDADHLWATPIFVPGRLSIGFHTFHTWPFMLAYGTFLFFKPPWQWLGMGLCLHMLTDWQDYYLW